MEGLPVCVGVGVRVGLKEVDGVDEGILLLVEVGLSAVGTGVRDGAGLSEGDVVGLRVLVGTAETEGCADFVAREGL